MIVVDWTAEVNSNCSALKQAAFRYREGSSSTHSPLSFEHSPNIMAVHFTKRRLITGEVGSAVTPINCARGQEPKYFLSTYDHVVGLSDEPPSKLSRVIYGMEIRLHVMIS